MQIERLNLHNYRNIENLSLTFDNNVTIFYGNNGQGKTNIVESIYYLAKVTSFRTNAYKELIKDGKDETTIEGEIKFTKQLKKQKIILTKEGKACFINDFATMKISEYLSSMNAVCFSPEDVVLFKDSPRERRYFLDSELSSLFPVYVKQLILFKKVLEQRNDLLKNKNIDKFLLEVIDDKLVEASYDIFIRRKWLIKKINEIVNLINEKITGKKDNIRIVYKTFLYEENKDEYLKKAKEILQNNFEKDYNYQFSNIGIHKDDFKTFLNNKAIDIYASQGQQRLMALLLKLALVEIIKKVNKEEPIIILDDAFSELDNSKKRALFNYIHDKQQVFITCTNYHDVITINEKNKNTIIHIQEGLVVERKVI